MESGAPVDSLPRFRHVGPRECGGERLTLLLDTAPLTAPTRIPASRARSDRTACITAVPAPPRQDSGLACRQFSRRSLRTNRSGHTEWHAARGPVARPAEEDHRPATGTCDPSHHRRRRHEGAIGIVGRAHSGPRRCARCGRAASTRGLPATGESRGTRDGATDGRDHLGEAYLPAFKHTLMSLLHWLGENAWGLPTLAFPGDAVLTSAQLSD